MNTKQAIETRRAVKHYDANHSMTPDLTPCIYPLIPITVSYFGGKSKEIQGRTLAHGILYVAGLSITNSILGLTASLTGGMMGFLLQKPVFLILVAGIMAFLALSFFDLWEFQLPSRPRSSSPQGKHMLCRT